MLCSSIYRFNEKLPLQLLGRSLKGRMRERGGTYSLGFSYQR